MTSAEPEGRDGESAEGPTSEDDRAVGRGFRRSLLAMAFVGAVALLVLVLRRPPVTEAGSASPVAPPLPAATAAAGEATGVAFRDVAAEAGVDFHHESGARGGKLLPECLAGGVAVVDLDGDARLDLVFTQGEPLEPSDADPAAGRGGVRVYRNVTEPGGPMRFERVPGDAELAPATFANGLAIGDFDGDGRVDLYVAAVRQDRLLLHRAADDGTIVFADATSAWLPAEDRWGSSAGAFDADGDGDLDLLVANYVRWSPEIDRAVGYTLDGVHRAYGPPTGFEGVHPTLLINEGGRFVDATRGSGVDVPNPVTGEPLAKALGLAFVDADRDGRTDVLVANDRTPKFLLMNRGVGPDGRPRFEDLAVASGFAFDRDGAATGAMGIDLAWHRNDGELAVAVGNFANEPSSLYVARPREGASSRPPAFADEALGQGFGAPTRRMLTFGTLFADLDLDGDEDLLQANGHLEPEIARFAPSQTYPQPAQLFVNRGGLSAPLFVEAPAAALGDLARPAVGRALAGGDLDGDGDLDLVLVDLGGPARVLENLQSTGNHWIAIALRGPHAVAAEIEVVATVGGRRVVQRRVLSPTRSYQAQSEPIARFGLGDAKRVESIRIRWANGLVTELRDVAVDRVEIVGSPRGPASGRSLSPRP